MDRLTEYMYGLGINIKLCEGLNFDCYVQQQLIVVHVTN